MKDKEFSKIVNDRLDKCRNLLVVKGLEYSGDDDRLKVFRKAKYTGGEDIKSMESALWGMANKHLVSIIDVVDNCSNDCDYFPTKDVIDNKITDMINYLLLLECCLQERINNHKPF